MVNQPQTTKKKKKKKKKKERKKKKDKKENTKMVMHLILPLKLYHQNSFMKIILVFGNAWCGDPFTAHLAKLGYLMQKWRQQPVGGGKRRKRCSKNMMGSNVAIRYLCKETLCKIHFITPYFVFFCFCFFLGGATFSGTPIGVFLFQPRVGLYFLFTCTEIMFKVSIVLTIIIFSP